MEQKINWFPGHMNKSLNEIKEKANLVDCFIVLLDSRAPISTYNNTFDLIAPNKPRLFILSKKDLCNFNKLNTLIKNEFNFKNGKDDYLVLNLKDNKCRQIIINKINNLLKQKKNLDKQKGLLNPKIKCFVVGMPNVGKSTFINLLVNKTKTKVANLSGTTRKNEWINAGDLYLLDTPGIMLPKINNNEQGVKLLMINVIKKEIISDFDFYNESIKILNIYEKDKLIELGLEFFDDEAKNYSQLLLYAKKNNFYKKNNQIDLEKALRNLREKILKLTNILLD